jgi:hypothetical protein
MLPQGCYAEPEKDQRTAPAGFDWKKMSIRARILRFALVAGGILSFILGLLHTMLRHMTRDRQLFGDVETPLLPTLI